MTKPYYERPGITIYHADCLDVRAQLSEIDTVLTDPPWGINYESHHNSGRGDCAMVRKNGNFAPIAGDELPFDPSPWLGYPKVVLWGANNYASKLPDHSGWLIWDKLAGKTPCQQSDCELAWTNTDNPVRIFTHLWRGIMRAGAENVSKSAKLHPHQKPVALLRWCIEQIMPSGTICDPYMGSGSTLVAATLLGLPVVGIDIAEWCCEITVKRLAQMSLFEMRGDD